MVELKHRTPLSDLVWIRGAWNSAKLAVAGTFGPPVRPEGYGKRLIPTLELDRVNGKLMLMGRNQTMRMLLQAPEAEPRYAPLGIRLSLSRR